MSNTPYLFTPTDDLIDPDDVGHQNTVHQNGHSSVGFYSTHLSYKPNLLYILHREGLDNTVTYDNPGFYSYIEELSKRLDTLINQLLEARQFEEYNLIEAVERNYTAEVPVDAASLISSRYTRFEIQNVTDDDIYDYFREECGITNFEMWQLYTLLWWGWVTGNFRRHISVELATQIVRLTTEEVKFLINTVIPEDKREYIVGNSHYVYCYILISGYIPDDIVPEPARNGYSNPGSSSGISPQSDLLNRMVYEDVNLVVQLYYSNFFNTFYDNTFGVGTMKLPGVPFYKALLDVVTPELLNLYFNVNEQNLEWYLSQIGIVKNIYYDSEPVSIDIWRYRIGSYAPFVKARMEQAPRAILNLFNIDVRNIQKYSDIELLDFYGYRIFKFPETHGAFTRWAFLHVISISVAFWQRWTGECDNDHINSIMMLEPRGTLDKTDTDDINIALVRMDRRRCFPASELEASFRNLGGFFIFYDPDYDYETPMIDPITDHKVTKAIPLIGIMNLHDFLINEDPTPTVSALIKKIEFGIGKYKDTDDYLQRFKDAVYASSHISQTFIQTYLSFIFLLSMWARFWKGPGYSYPVIWNEAMSQDLCPALQRDKHIDIEFNVYGQLMSEMERFMPSLVGFINKLPLIHYSWTQGFYVKADEEFIRNELGAYYMSETINGAQHGLFCLAQFGDILAQSAYVYMRVGLGYSDNKVNELLIQTMVKMRTFENIAITTERSNLQKGKDWFATLPPDTPVNTPDGAISYEEYKNRLVQAEQSINDHSGVVNIVGQVEQPPLMFSEIQDTMHIQM